MTRGGKWPGPSSTTKSATAAATPGAGGALSADSEFKPSPAPAAALHGTCDLSAFPAQARGAGPSPRAPKAVML